MNRLLYGLLNYNYKVVVRSYDDDSSISTSCSNHDIMTYVI